MMIFSPLRLYSCTFNLFKGPIKLKHRYKSPNKKCLSPSTLFNIYKLSTLFKWITDTEPPIFKWITDHGYRASSSFSWLSSAHEGLESSSLLQGSPAKGSVSSRHSEAEDFVGHSEPKNGALT